MEYDQKVSENNQTIFNNLASDAVESLKRASLMLVKHGKTIVAIRMLKAIKLIQEAQRFDPYFSEGNDNA